jgi:hypothetical protein
MARSGCRSVFFGIESGSPSVQHQMKKRLNVSTAREMVAACLRHGITPTCSFIVGFPEETEADLNLTLTMALECRLLGTPSIQLHPMSPLPGTELTVGNQYPLQFRPEAARVHDAIPAGAISSEELAMIRSHPRIFSSFYIIEPVHLSVDLVYLSSAVLTPLIWHTPLTLYWYMRAAGLTPSRMAERVGEQLAAGTLAWEPAAVFGALGKLVAELGMEWLGALLRWEVARWRVQQAPPVRAVARVRGYSVATPLEWAPGAQLVESDYALEAVMRPPDAWAPPPVPSPPRAPSVYLLVRDGMTVRTLGLQAETARILAAVTAPGHERSAGPPEAVEETVRQFQRAGVLRRAALGAGSLLRRR